MVQRGGNFSQSVRTEGVPGIRVACQLAGVLLSTFSRLVLYEYFLGTCFPCTLLLGPISVSTSCETTFPEHKVSRGAVSCKHKAESRLMPLRGW